MSRGSGGQLVGLALLLTLTSCSPQSDVHDLDLHRGDNALAMGRYEWARFYFSADLEQHPERQASIRGLGLAWFSGAERSLTKAIEYFERHLENDPEDPDIRLRLAEAWFLLRESDKAAATLAEASPSQRADLLAARIHLDRDPQLAARHVRAALDAAPDEVGSHVLAAKVFARLGDDRQAVVHATRAANLGIRADAFYVLATSLRRLGEDERSQQALEAYDLLRATTDTHLATHEELTLWRRFQTDHAPEGVFGSAELQAKICSLLLATGRFDEALPAARELAASPEAEATTLFGLAQIAHTTGRQVLAQDLYSGVLERDPAHRGARTNLAQLLYEANQWDEAQRIVAVGLDTDPHYGPFHFVRGLVALSQGGDEAEAALKKAVDLVPWEARYRIALADVLLTRGDRPAFDRLLAETPAPDPVIEAYRRRHSL